MTAPPAALILVAVFAFLGLGWRGWLQYRRTGSSGFKGVGGGQGPTEWVAALGLVLAAGIVVAAPALQWAGVLSPVSVLDAPWIRFCGLLGALFGIIGTVYAELDMGDAWRVGMDPAERTALVDTGSFGQVRNPIYTAMLVFVAGIALITPNIAALIGSVLLLIAVEVQVRGVEEPYLEAVHGDSYRRYAARVGRFIPGCGRIPDPD